MKMHPKAAKKKPLKHGMDKAEEDVNQSAKSCPLSGKDEEA